MQSVFFNYPFYVADPTSIDWQAWLVLQLKHTHIQPDTQTSTTLNQTLHAAPGEHPNLRNARSFSYLAQTKLGFCIFFNFFQFIGRSRKYFSHCQISVKQNYLVTNKSKFDLQLQCSTLKLKVTKVLTFLLTFTLQGLWDYPKHTRLKCFNQNKILSQYFTVNL